MAGKLGLAKPDADLTDRFLAALPGADWTQAFQRLAQAVTDGRALTAMVADPPAMEAWLQDWRAALDDQSLSRMAQANPVVIPRNHLVEAALDAATAGDMAPFHALLTELQRPYAPAAGREGFTLPAPSGFGPYVTFCGT
jgi:serine/tyrosine/threonine adenylyltransferase